MVRWVWVGGLTMWCVCARARVSASCGVCSFTPAHGSYLIHSIHMHPNRMQTNYVHFTRVSASAHTLGITTVCAPAIDREREREEKITYMTAHIHTTARMSIV